jgi:hypothetical protein
VKKLRIPLLVVILVAAMLAPVAAGGPQEKVTLCHKPGTPAEVTITVGAAAVDAHLAHGDYYGECWQPSDGCQAVNAYVPDPQSNTHWYYQAVEGVFNAGETLHAEITAIPLVGVADITAAAGILGGDFDMDSTTAWGGAVTPGEPVTMSADWVITADGTQGAVAVWVGDSSHELVSVDFTCTR